MPFLWFEKKWTTKIIIGEFTMYLSLPRFSEQYAAIQH